MTPSLLWDLTLGSWLTAALLLLCRFLFGRWLCPQRRVLLWLLLPLGLLPLRALPFPLFPLRSPVSLLPHLPDLETVTAQLSPPAATLTAAAQTVPAAPDPWPVLRTLWHAGIGILLGIYAGLYLRCFRQLNALPPCGDLETEREYLYLNQLFHPGYHPRLVRGTEGMLGGFLRPALVIPADRVGAGAVPILLHEMMHYRGGDLWLTLLYRLFCAVYWFNPVLWLCFWLYRRDAELACDERVLDTGLVKPKEYAETLLEEFELRGSPDPMPLARFGAAGVKRRIRAILNYRKRRKGAAVLPACLGLTILALSVLSPYTGRSFGIERRDLSRLVGYPDPEAYVAALQPSLGAFGLTHAQLMNGGYVGTAEGEWTRQDPEKQVLTLTRQSGEGEPVTLHYVFRPTLFTREAGTCVLTEIWGGESAGPLFQAAAPVLVGQQSVGGGASTWDLTAPYYIPDEGRLGKTWGILDWTWAPGEREEWLALEDPDADSRYSLVFDLATVWDCLEEEDAETLAALIQETGLARSREEALHQLQYLHLCGILRHEASGTFHLMGMGAALYETRPSK